MNSSQVFEEDYVSELAQESAPGRRRQRKRLLTSWQAPVSTRLDLGRGQAIQTQRGDSKAHGLSVLAVTVLLHPSSTHIPCPFAAPSSLFLTVLSHPKCTSALDSRLTGPVEVGDVFTSPAHGDSGA